jgi:hypothetical protein
MRSPSSPVDPGLGKHIEYIERVTRAVESGIRSGAIDLVNCGIYAEEELHYLDFAIQQIRDYQAVGGPEVVKEEVMRLSVFFVQARLMEVAQKCGDYLVTVLKDGQAESK